VRLVEPEANRVFGWQLVYVYCSIRRNAAVCAVVSVTRVHLLICCAGVSNERSLLAGIGSEIRSYDRPNSDLVPIGFLRG